MQLVGTQFTSESALAGNDIATVPDFPAEIRAPAGTLAGVSSFQLNFSSSEIFTAGDEPNVLVAMNPAALKANLEDLPANAVLIIDKEAFTEANLKRAGYTTNPLIDHSLDKYQIFEVDVTRLTSLALQGSGLSNRDAFRCRNMFVLGMLSWLYQRPVESATKYIESRFKKNQPVLDANLKALKAGWNYGETTEMFASSYVVPKAADLAGILSQHHRQQCHRDGLRRRGQSRRTVRYSSVRIRLLPPATFFMNSRATKITTCIPSRPRTRSRAYAPRSAPLSVARLRSPRLPALE